MLELITRDDNAVAACVHLNQLEVAAIERAIKEFIIELEHSHLCQLIRSNSDPRTDDSS